MSKRLRLYLGTDEDAQIDPLASDAVETNPKTVTVKLGDVLGAMQDAKNKQRLWLHDFADEEVTISADLYEVIMAYEGFRRESA